MTSHENKEQSRTVLLAQFLSAKQWGRERLSFYYTPHANSSCPRFNFLSRRWNQFNRTKETNCRNETLPWYTIHRRPLRYRLRTRWRRKQIMEIEENLRCLPSFDCLSFGLFFPHPFLASLHVLDLPFANESDSARSGLVYHVVDECMFLKCG